MSCVTALAARVAPSPGRRYRAPVRGRVPGRDRHGRASGREAGSGVLVRGVVRPYLRQARLRVNGSSAACQTLGA
jgi:hypothetical protein